jgi:hypothetical protein
MRTVSLGTSHLWFGFVLSGIEVPVHKCSWSSSEKSFCSSLLKGLIKTTKLHQNNGHIFIFSKDFIWSVIEKEKEIQAL